MTNYYYEYCDEILRLSFERYVFTVGRFKSVSLISNVIYEAMTANFCPLYRELPYIEFSYFEWTLSPIGTAGAPKIYQISLR